MFCRAHADTSADSSSVPRDVRSTARRSVHIAAAVAMSTSVWLASCSDPISRAEERRRFVFDHGGTNREVCKEARKVKAAYVSARRHDDGAWLAVDVHCTDADGPMGDMIAKEQASSAMAGHR